LEEQFERIQKYKDAPSKLLENVDPLFVILYFLLTILEHKL